ncbi:TrkH family potassium uptake protein, partial [bacterium]|nr:TrkH family potassium uptake protein [bacterium]
SSILLTMLLMFVGGSSGSTAGGIKITTFVVILFGLKTIIKPNSSITIGKKKLEDGVLRQALAIFSSYMIAIFFCSIIICAIEPLSMKAVIFEVISAIGTVGLSLGITPQLSVVSKILIGLLMYAGRVGILTIVLAFVQKRSNPPVQKPTGELLIG